MMTTRFWRELDQRHTDGLTITLVWGEAANEIAVVIDDHKNPNASTSVAVDPSEALYAFHHPFVYFGRQLGRELVS